jgi:DNA-binding transcriptional ArsR family regulator
VKAAVRRSKRGEVLALLGEELLTFEEIHEQAAALSKNTVRRRLGELVEHGLAERLGEGKRSDPHRWRLSDNGRIFLENGLGRNAEGDDGNPSVQAESFFPTTPTPRGEGGREETLACELHPGVHTVAARAAGFTYLSCGCRRLEEPE